MCNMCMIPFDKDPGPRESDQFCSYCFKNGELIYKGDSLKEFKEMMYKNVRARGVNPITAWFYTFTAGFAPYWKDKK